MQELTAAVSALIELGGWGALVLVAVAIAVGGMRRKWVWGWQFDRESARADKAEQAALKTAESLERLSASVDTIVETALRGRGDRA